MEKQESEYYLKAAWAALLACVGIPEEQYSEYSLYAAWAALVACFGIPEENVVVIPSAPWCCLMKWKGFPFLRNLYNTFYKRRVHDRSLGSVTCYNIGTILFFVFLKAAPQGIEAKLKKVHIPKGIIFLGRHHFSKVASRRKQVNSPPPPSSSRHHLPPSTFKRHPPPSTFKCHPPPSTFKCHPTPYASEDRNGQPSPLHDVVDRMEALTFSLPANFDQQLTSNTNVEPAIFEVNEEPPGNLSNGPTYDQGTADDLAYTPADLSMGDLMAAMGCLHIDPKSDDPDKLADHLASLSINDADAPFYATYLESSMKCLSISEPSTIHHNSLHFNNASDHMGKDKGEAGTAPKDDTVRLHPRSMALHVYEDTHNKMEEEDILDKDETDTTPKNDAVLSHLIPGLSTDDLYLQHRLLDAAAIHRMANPSPFHEDWLDDMDEYEVQDEDAYNEMEEEDILDKDETDTTPKNDAVLSHLIPGLSTDDLYLQHRLLDDAAAIHRMANPSPFHEDWLDDMDEYEVQDEDKSQGDTEDEISSTGAVTDLSSNSADDINSDINNDINGDIVTPPGASNTNARNQKPKNSQNKNFPDPRRI